MNTVGKCSWFGGPDDAGVAPDESLAFIYSVDQQPLLFLPAQPPGTTGLARRLDPKVHYLACRWDYAQTPREQLLAQKATVKATKTGKVFSDVYPADWGPHINTGRVADLSPGLMADLGIETDDQVEVTFPAAEQTMVAAASTMLDPAAIDFSHHNGVTSFEQIAAHGVVGMIAKATEGGSYVDPTYKERIGPAISAGLLWGAYHFLRPGDMKHQAAHFVAAAGPDIDIYCADHEDPGVSLGSLKTFLAEVERITGKVPVLYSGNVIKEQLGSVHDAELARCRLWIAHYTSAHAPTWPAATWPTWWLWQYTENGACPGLTGLIDVNRYQGTAAQLTAEWAGTMRIASKRSEWWSRFT